MYSCFAVTELEIQRLRGFERPEGSTTARREVHGIPREYRLLQSLSFPIHVYIIVTVS